ncbi:MAG: hypothetical protein Q9227_003869 [Pyrenula ochraceoflavens]
MASIAPGAKQRESLPSLGFLDLEKAKRDGVERQHKYPPVSGLSISTAPLVSPTTMYSGPPPPYSYPSSTTSSGPHTSGYISPPDSRKTTDEEKEPPPLQPPPPPPPRQSLPSISEALAGDKSMPYPPGGHPMNHPTAPQPPYLTPSASAPSRSFPEAPAGPSNPFSHPQSLSNVHRDGPTQSPHHSTPVKVEAEPPRTAFPAVNAEARPPSIPTFPFSKSPRMSNVPTSQTTLGSDIGPPPVPSPRLGGYPGPAQYPSHRSNPPNPIFAPPQWEYEERRKAFASQGHEAPYSDSVKRHLDIYDSEQTLSDVSKCSKHTMEWAEIMLTRFNPRSGLRFESMPSVQEVDDMLRFSGRVSEALTHMREIVITQQNLIAEQQARAFKGEAYDDELNGFHDDFKGGGFAGGDAKKRRGKAAPPGRCHSCNRAETPEWRRGPDGARTLCNACGLHYAKLTRKIGATKASAMSGSNLRPKAVDARSPHP